MTDWYFFPEQQDFGNLTYNMKSRKNITNMLQYLIYA